MQQAPFLVYKSAPVGALKSTGTIRLLLTSMRPHQWIKNLFVLAPLLFSMKLQQANASLNASLAFIVFCALSSALYLFNDVIDERSDRAHPEKCHRPVASGALSVPTALAGSIVLLTFALVLSAKLGFYFSLLTLAYLIVTLGYCLAFKQTLILDGMLIATGFVLRVVGGAVAISVAPTHWLVVCAFLLALFLAFSKRRQELLMLSARAAQHRAVLGQYTVKFLDQANNILLGATIVCYALYTVAPETVQRFGTDALIYGTVFVIYGLLRYMALLDDVSKGGNPSQMLLRDKPLLFSVACWALYNALVIYRSSISFGHYFA